MTAVDSGSAGLVQRPAKAGRGLPGLFDQAPPTKTED